MDELNCVGIGKTSQGPQENTNARTAGGFASAAERESVEAMAEEWRAIAGYEGYYEVSNLGRVRSLDRIVTNKGKPLRRRQKIIAPQINVYSGYFSLKLCRYGLMRRMILARLVAEAFIANPHNLREVNHIDGRKENNAASNLEWNSPSQNMRHAADNGLIKSKGRHSKLTEENVRAIRNLRRNGRTLMSIAKEFSVNITTIFKIIKGTRRAGVSP